jgi:hypothetical protein
MPIRNYERAKGRYAERTRRFDEFVAGHGPTCAHCGHVMQYSRSTRRYCSSNCRQQAYRLRLLCMTRAELQTKIDRLVNKARQTAESQARIAQLRKLMRAT